MNLEQCPWCPDTDSLFPVEEGAPDRTRYRIWCPGCDIAGPEGLDEQGAAEQWNRRWGKRATEGHEASLNIENERLEARVALLEHQADCRWYDLGAGAWAREHCAECDRLSKELEAAKAAGGGDG